MKQVNRPMLKGQRSNDRARVRFAACRSLSVSYPMAARRAKESVNLDPRCRLSVDTCDALSRWLCRLESVCMLRTHGTPRQLNHELRAAAVQPAHGPPPLSLCGPSMPMPDRETCVKTLTEMTDSWSMPVSSARAAKARKPKHGPHLRPRCFSPNLNSFSFLFPSH
jgi:hypothetical protein